MAPETHQTAFCQSLPWRNNIEWFDLTGLLGIDDKRHAKLTLREGCFLQYYVGFHIEIQSKRIRLLDQKLFLFSDYMNSRDPAERADDRHDVDSPFTVTSRDWCWHVGVPKHPEKFTSAVERYIEFWK